MTKATPSEDPLVQLNVDVPAHVRNKVKIDAINFKLIGAERGLVVSVALNEFFKRPAGERARLYSANSKKS